MSMTSPTTNQLENILEAVFNAGKIESGKLVTKNKYPGDYIALSPEKALPIITSLLASKLKELESKARTYTADGETYLRATPVEVIQEMLKEIE